MILFLLDSLHLNSDNVFSLVQLIFTRILLFVKTQLQISTVSKPPSGCRKN